MIKSNRKRKVTHMPKNMNFEVSLVNSNCYISRGPIVDSIMTGLESGKTNHPERIQSGSSFPFHVHYLPKLASMAFILRASIASPPISICITIDCIFHIRPQDSRDSTITSRYTGQSKIRSVKTECDVNAAVRRFNSSSRFTWRWRFESVDSWLRRN